MESVSLAGLDNLTHFGLRDRVDMRPTLLRVLTDLYVQKLTHTPDEERHYTELALRLLDAVDAPTRVAVADRLARHLSPPLRVIKQLAADLPEVAASARAHPILQGKPPPSEPLTKAAPAPRFRGGGIHQTRDGDTQTMEDGRAGQSHDTITGDIANELNELFFAATADERRLILLNLEIAAPICSGSVQVARDAAIGRQLETAALARNREDFVRQLAGALQIPPMQARRIATDTLGEPVVAAAKALDLPRDLVWRILLFVNTTIGHSVERVHTLATLYDEVSVKAAEHMVAIWQALRREEHAAMKYRPLLWNDEARARARTATAAVRRAPAQQRNDRRHAS